MTRQRTEGCSEIVPKASFYVYDMVGGIGFEPTTPRV